MENQNDCASGSFTFDSVHLAPEEQIGLHQQPSWELSYIIVGSGMKLIGDQTEPFRSGEVVLIPPEIPHCWYFDSDQTDTRGRIANITVTFTDDFLDRCACAFPEIGSHVARLKQRRDAVKFDKSKAETLIALLEEMRDKTPAQRIAPMMSLLLLIAEDDRERVVGKYQKIDKEQNRLKQVEIYVICNAKREISLDDVARHVGMNRASFCVFFKRATGKTFVTYLNEHRVELVCRLLREKKLTVSEICFQAGFNNVPYFHRVFKRLKGVPPREFAG